MSRNNAKKKQPENWPGVIGRPLSHRQFLHGINTIADLLAPTLGPTGGPVASGPDAGQRVEILDDAATIVRRIISLGLPQKDVGAMVMRNLIWRVGQRAGDGGATAAVLARAIYCDGLRLTNAGYNQMRLIRGVEEGVRIATAALKAQARPVTGENELANVARTITKDYELASVLGEMSYLLGPDAHVVIEKFVAPYLQRRYIAGAYFGAEISSMYFYTQPEQKKTVLNEPAVAILEERLDQVEQVVPLMEAAIAQGAESLLIVAQDVGGAALGALVANTQAPEDKKKLTIMAVKLKAVGQEARWAMTDLELLTDANILGPNQTRDGAHARAGDLGHAQRAEFVNNGLVVVAHDANRDVVQQEITNLRTHITSLPLDDEDRPKYIKRLSTLTGGVGELKIGAHSKGEREMLEAQAERAFKVLSSAQRDGVVAGGGAALFHCIPALNAAADQTTDEDIKQGIRLLANALATPLRQIAINAGVPAPAVVLQQVRDGGPSMTFDALSGRVVDAHEAGVLDVTDIVTKVLQIAASGATMALSTDTIVYHRKPQESMTP
ncbi:MAG: TCP-1/cpn60 chaperonin family protein [Caldilineaceae bacterium]